MSWLATIIDLIPEARVAAAEALVETEVRPLPWLRGYAGRDVVGKLENHQATGSFKARGAYFAIRRVRDGRGVVAPSAGNHGLAVGWASERLGVPATIVLPETVSPLKRERILRLGAGVVETGSTVEAATGRARALAAESGWTYLSPFNDPAVIAGQATAVVELLERRPDLESLVVPVGGGGLLAGAIAARDLLGRDLRIVGVEPTEFASMTACLEAGKYVRVGRRPTFADGLATNLEASSITIEVAREARDVVLCGVSEEEIAAACSAAFNRESLLLEGAAAAGIAATLRADELGLPNGPIGLVVCGGNVHHTTFWRMLAFGFTDPALVALADTFGRVVDEEPRRRAFDVPRQEPPAPVPGIAHDGAVLPLRLLDEVNKYTGATGAMLHEYAKLAELEGLPLESGLVGLLRDVNDRVRTGVMEATAGERSWQRGEQWLRALQQLGTAVRQALEWRSPGYEQSAALAGFDPGALGSPGVNYARYDQPGVADLERRLTETLGVSTRSHAVLATSSGMAAFSVVAGTLLAIDRVRAALTAPYLYFEAAEMLRYWLGDCLVTALSYDALELARHAEGARTDVVLADPLANHPEQRMVDVSLLAATLADGSASPWLVVDGTMLPTVTAAPVALAYRRAFYYESCSKYLQLGLDIAMAGLVVVPREHEAMARRVRRNLGLGLDRYGVELFPRYRPEDLEQRLGAMERAALTTASALADRLAGSPFDVAFPGLDDHPDNKLARRVGRSGSCVTLVPRDATLSRDQLAPVVDSALREAKARGLPLVNGVSFGFSASRLSAASALAEAAPPFLRLAVGLLSPRQSVELADVLLRAVEQSTSIWPSRPAPGPAVR